MSATPLAAALQQFEVAEANLVKLEALWKELSVLTPDGIAFGTNPEYEDRCRAFVSIMTALPKIDGWKPEDLPADLDEIAQWRLDAKEIGEFNAEVTVEKAIEAPGKGLREYRAKLNRKRRELIRDALVRLIDAIDGALQAIRPIAKTLRPNDNVPDASWKAARAHVDEIEALLGSSVERPGRWSELRRHLHFGMVCDFDDIQRLDWPSVKKGLRQGLYGAHEPLPMEVDDLSQLVAAKPRGTVTTKLSWVTIDPESFERLIFALISKEENYENPEWLMKTNAADRGRDLSVIRITKDALSGTTRSRVIIQCRHRPDASVSVADIAALKQQMTLWDDPRVNVLVVATTGRFTADGVAAIEKHNASDTALKIEMWPESHLEMLLASRPGLIAEFALR
jgi:hypothetical protein